MISQVFFPKPDCLFSDVKLKRRKASYTKVMLPLSVSHHKKNHHSGKSVAVFGTPGTRQAESTLFSSVWT